MSIFRLYHDSATGMWRLEVRQNNNKTAEVIVKTQKRMQQQKQQQQKYQNICSSDKVFPPFLSPSRTAPSTPLPRPMTTRSGGGSGRCTTTSTAEEEKGKMTNERTTFFCYNLWWGNRLFLPEKRPREINCCAANTLVKKFKNAITIFWHLERAASANE